VNEQKEGLARLDGSAKFIGLRSLFSGTESWNIAGTLRPEDNAQIYFAIRRLSSMFENDRLLTKHHHES